MPKHRLVPMLIILHLVAAFAILIWNGLMIPEVMVGDFLISWLLNRTMLMWVRLAIPITLFIILLRFSLLPILFREQGTEGLPEHRMALGSMLILVLILTIVRLIFMPGFTSAEQDIRSKSVLVRQTVEQARDLSAAGAVYQAMSRVENALSLAPGYPEGVVLREEIYNQVATREAEFEPETPSNPPKLPQNQSFADLLEKARQAIADEDFFTALYYAETALSMQGMGEEPRARALREQARRSILRLELSEGEQQDYEMFRQKRQGLDAYDQGRYIEAFYIFSELEAEDPLDPDVLEWFPLIQEKLQQMTFFIGTAQQTLSKQVRGPIAWIVPPDEYQNHPGNLIISAEFIARDSLGYFLYDIEMIGIGAAPGSAEVSGDDSGVLASFGSGVGEVWYHAKAPYGKIVVDSVMDEPGWYLLTRGIDREQPGRDTGLQEDVSGPMSLEVAPEVLHLSASPQMLWDLGAGAQGIEGIGTGAILGILSQADALGHRVEAVAVEAADRLLSVLLDLVVLLAMLVLAWHGRVLESGPRIIGSFVMLPFAALLVWALYQGARWLMLLAVTLLVQVGGLVLALVVMVPVLGIIFIFVLLRYSVLYGRR